jgi:hypothetical protein
MAAKSTYANNKVLAGLLENTALPSNATLYVGLWTATLTAASTGSTAGEVSDVNYARQPVTSASGWNPTPPTASSVSNVGTLAFFGAGAAAGPYTVTYVAICDALTAGNILYWGPLAVAKTVNVGDTLSFAASALSVSES